MRCSALYCSVLQSCVILQNTSKYLEEFSPNTRKGTEKSSSSAVKVQKAMKDCNTSTGNAKSRECAGWCVADRIAQGPHRDNILPVVNGAGQNGKSV